MSIVENAVQWAISTAQDNSHGYSQACRWSPDYDCSSFVISAYKLSGVPLQSTYTGNMYADFMSHGFKDVTKEVDLASGVGLKRGDVLLNVSCHTCIYIGNGQVVNCRTDTDGKQGDSRGDEIRIQNYWNFPWDYVLRFNEEDEEQPMTEIGRQNHLRSDFRIERGDGMNNPLPQVQAWQLMLNSWGYGIEADGEFGDLTYAATLAWQERCKETYGGDVEVNGVVDQDDWAEIIRIPTD